MKKPILLSLIVLTPIIAFMACTKNARAKNWGGKQTINIPANQKFVNATWKEANLWIVTRDRNTNDIKETFYFKENSSFGVMEGEIKFVEP